MSGDTENCDELVISNLGLVYSIAKKRCSPYIREDAAQEAAIKLLKVAKFHDPKKASFSTYAGTCISNRILDYMKAERRRAEHFRPFSMGRPEPVIDRTPLDEIVKKEDQEFIEKLHEAVRDLPLYERFIITFHYGLHGETPHSLRDVSEMVKKPYGTVKSMEQRAYKKLRAALKGECA